MFSRRGLRRRLSAPHNLTHDDVHTSCSMAFTRLISSGHSRPTTAPRVNSGGDPAKESGSPLSRGRAEREQEFQPDRAGTVLGLSLTGFHHISYADWGPAQADTPLLCVHGLSRQGRDFDYLAAELVTTGKRVVCPDLV